MRRLWFIFAAALFACPDPSDAPDANRTDAAPDAGPQEDAAPLDADPIDADPIDATSPDADAGSMSDPEDCDPLQPAVCSFPWPSNLYLVDDPSRATGYTLAFGDTTLPANDVGTHVDPEPYRRMDGYGLGTPILVLFPNLDFAGSGLDDESDIDASLEPDAPILLYRVSGTELIRVPYFAELDGFETDPARRTLIVRPAVILEEATRYAVAIRNLRDTAGNVYDQSEAFAALRSGNATDPLLAPRQAGFTEIFALLSSNGIDPDSLQLAWDFVTASSGALHGRLLAMRDDAFSRMPMGPALTITSTTEYIADDDPDLWFRVEGSMTVPSYLRTKAINFFTHTVLNLDANGVPAANGTRTARFWINVPRSAMSSTTSHGLLI